MRFLVCVCHIRGTVLEVDMTYICSPSCYGWAGIQVDTRRRCHPSVFPYRCAHSRDSCPCRWVPPLCLLVALWRKQQDQSLSLNRHRNYAHFPLKPFSKQIVWLYIRYPRGRKRSKNTQMPDTHFDLQSHICLLPVTDMPSTPLTKIQALVGTCLLCSGCEKGGCQQKE